MKDWLHYPAFCGAASTLRIMKKLVIPGGGYTSKRSASKDRKRVSMLMCEQQKKRKSDVKGRK
jgi:hypothetical protein